MIYVCFPSLELFNVLTALFCYRLLTPHMDNQSAIYWRAVFQSGNNFKFLATAANEDFETGYPLVPDIDNATNIQMVCSGLTVSDCQRWLSCSRAGSDCCKKHLARNMTGKLSASHCEATWDGISCFDSTPNGTAVDLECPQYYVPTDGSVKTTKTCLPSGNWHTPKGGIIVNDTIHTYTICKKQKKKVNGAEPLEILRLVTLVTNLISLTFLFPSLAVFILFRPHGNSEADSKMRRVFWIHQHFLMSLIFVSIVTLIMDEFIVREHVNLIHRESSLIDKNSPLCRMIILLQKYFRSATYFWMFVEGLNVLIPLLQSFNTEIRVVWLSIIGWVHHDDARERTLTELLLNGIPLITAAVYASLRMTIERFNFKCWIYMFPEIEWIIFVPDVITILCNTVFLIAVVAIIAVKERRMQSARSCVPKPLRCLVFLIPLFGSHFVFALLSYAWDADWPYVVSRAVEGLQGVLVCILWVVCSKQVQKHFMKALQRNCPHFFARFRGRKSSTSSNTHLTQALHQMNATPIPCKDTKPQKRPPSHPTVKNLL